MNRIMNMMQRLRLFGTCRWTGRQLCNVPQEHLPIQGLQYQEFSISKSVANLWICIDLWGLRFWSVEDAAIDNANQCFPFAWLVEMYSIQHPDWFSDQKVIQWGAQNNILQFIVQTSGEPGVNKSIVLESSESQDIVHVTNVACEDSKSSRLDNHP